MKAVMCEVSPSVLQERARKGIDRYDEMWDGVLHMPLAANREHLNFEGELETWLRMRWAYRPGYRVYHGPNVASVGGWPDYDYRIPDLVLLTPESSAVDHNEYFEGAPTVVIEIRSPGDETMEKMPFYAKLGVPEVWVFGRDTREPTLWVLSEGSYEEQQPNTAGWLISAATDIQFRPTLGRHLEIQCVEHPDTRGVLPHD